MTEREFMASDSPLAMLRIAAGRRSNCCGCLWADNGDGTESLVGKPCCHLCDNARPVIGYTAVVSDRKLRLFACAAWRMANSRRTWKSDRLDRGIISAERSADGDHYTIPKDQEPLSVLFGVASDAAMAAARNAPVSCDGGSVTDREVADILRDTVGDPFRPVKLPRSKMRCRCGGDYSPCKKNSLPLPVAVCTKCFSGGPWWKDVAAGGLCPWVTPVVTMLANAAYSDRLPDGSLDPVTLLALADALEESGCDDDDILFHLRGVVGCDRCEGAMFVYESQSLSSRRACPKCEGEGLIKPGPKYRGMWSLDVILGKS